MREIQASTITDVVEKLCIEANYHLPEDVYSVQSLLQKLCYQKVQSWEQFYHL